jgi:hypothetical protein
VITHEGSSGLTRPTAISVGLTTPPPRLGIAILGQGAGVQAEVVLNGTAGQQQVIQMSTNLSTWVPLATNSLGTNSFAILDPNPRQYPERFYRAVVLR